DAAVSERRVERRLVVLLVQQRAKVAQVRSELLGGNRRVVPALPSRGLARSIAGGARSGLAYLPHGARFACGVKPRHRRIPGRSMQAVHQPPRRVKNLRRIVGTKFNQQQATALGQEIETRRSLPPEAID